MIRAEMPNTSIAPLDSVFKLAQFFGGPVRLVVSGSGHIAGVVNPPAAQKYQYWINDQGKAGSVEEWFAGATETARRMAIIRPFLSH